MRYIYTLMYLINHLFLIYKPHSVYPLTYVNQPACHISTCIPVWISSYFYILIFIFILLHELFYWRQRWRSFNLFKFVLYFSNDRKIMKWINLLTILRIFIDCFILFLVLCILTVDFYKVLKKHFILFYIYIFNFK